MPVINPGTVKTLNFDTIRRYRLGGVIYRDKYGRYTTDARTYTGPVGVIIKEPTAEDNYLIVKLIATGKCLMDYEEYRK